VRDDEGREATPTVAIIDSQTAKVAGKKIKVASGTSWSTRWVSC
jgi:hypothetical protein